MTIIKVCGLTNSQDVDQALELGADWLGFIHVPKSPRYVELAQLEQLLIRAQGAHRVVVVRNMQPEELARLRERMPFESYQFHGDEPLEYVQRFGGYRVFHMEAQTTDLPKTFGTPFLLDTTVRGIRGGSGITFDWSVLPRVGGTFLVAGGLTPQNVGELIQRYQPWGVDVSSGVEEEPRRKSPQLLASFIKNVRREAAL